MPTLVKSIPSQNITLLYDKLDLSPEGIDRTRLRQIGGPKAAVMDTDEMIVVIQPLSTTILQLGDRRIRVTIQKPEKEVGKIPFWVTAHQLHELVKERSKLEAYGFNYDIEVETAGDGAAILQNLFVPDKALLESKITGKLLAISPRLKYERNNIRYDLNLEPGEGNNVKAHLNAHKETHELPPQNVLERDYKNVFAEFSETLTRLLEVSQ